MGNLLVVQIEMYDLGGDLVKSWSIPAYKCVNPLNALVLGTNPFKFSSDIYIMNVRMYDMDGYLWEWEEEPVKTFEIAIVPQDSAKILPRRPMPGEVVLVGWDSLDYRTDWWTNDYGVRRKFFYSTDNGASWIPIMDDGYDTITDPGDLYLIWDVSGLSDCNYAKVKVEYYLGRHAKLIAETEGPFIMRVPPIYPKRWNKWLAGDVRDIEVAEDSCRYVFALTKDRIYKSKDYGKTWSEILSVASPTLCELAVSSDGRVIVAGSKYTSGNTFTLYVSKNGGRTFKTVTYTIPGSGTPGEVIDGVLKDIIFTGDGRTYIAYSASMNGVGKHEIALSSDTCKTWNIPYFPPFLPFGHLDSLSIAWHYLRPNTLYIASGCEVHILDVGGGTHERIYEDPDEEQVRDIAVINDNNEVRVYIARKDEVLTQIPDLASKDEPERYWRRSHYIDANSPVLSLASSDRKGMLIASTGWYGCGVYLEKNRDNNWEKITSRWGSAPEVVEVSPLDIFSNSWNGIYYAGRNDGLYVYNPFYGPPGEIAFITPFAVSPDSFGIEWSDLHDVIGYWVYWAKVNEDYKDSMLVVGRNSAVIHSTVENLKVKVKVFNWEGSSEKEIVIRRIRPPVIEFAMPHDTGSIWLKIKDRTSFTVGYEVWRKKDNGVWEKVGDIPSGNWSDIEYVDAEISGNGKYTYKLRPVISEPGVYVFDSDSAPCDFMVANPLSGFFDLYSGGIYPALDLWTTSDGLMHVVYSGLWKLWHSISSDNGRTWSKSLGVFHPYIMHGTLLKDTLWYFGKVGSNNVIAWNVQGSWRCRKAEAYAYYTALAFSANSRYFGSLFSTSSQDVLYISDRFYNQVNFEWIENISGNVKAVLSEDSVLYFAGKNGDLFWGAIDIAGNYRSPLAAQLPQQDGGYVDISLYADSARMVWINESDKKVLYGVGHYEYRGTINTLSYKVIVDNLPSIPQAVRINGKNMVTFVLQDGGLYFAYSDRPLSYWYYSLVKTGVRPEIGAPVALSPNGNYFVILYLPQGSDSLHVLRLLAKPEISILSPSLYDHNCRHWRIGYPLRISWEVYKSIAPVCSCVVYLHNLNAIPDGDIKRIGVVPVNDNTSPFDTLSLSFTWVPDEDPGEYEILINVYDVLGKVGTATSDEFILTDELVLNSSFEDGLCCWEKLDGVPMEVETGAVHGDSCVKFILNGVEDYASLRQVDIPVVPGESYWLSGWIKTSLDGGRAKMDIRDGAGAYSMCGNLRGDNEWRYVYTQFIPQANRAQIRLVAGRIEVDRWKKWVTIKI